MFYEPITPHDDFAGRVEARPDPQAPPSALVMVLARALRGLRDQRRGEPGDSTAVLVAVIVVRGPYAPAEAVRALFPSDVLANPATPSPWAFGDIAGVEWVTEAFARLIAAGEAILTLDGRAAHVAVVPSARPAARR
jgi:hypothetical protein